MIDKNELIIHLYSLYVKRILIECLPCNKKAKSWMERNQEIEENRNKVEENRGRDGR